MESDKIKENNKFFLLKTNTGFHVRVEIRDLIDQFNKTGWSKRREKRIGHAACIISVIFYWPTITRAKTSLPLGTDSFCALICRIRHYNRRDLISIKKNVKIFRNSSPKA